MPGEWSKRVGQSGEGLVEEYFKLIGWADAQKTFDVPCIKPEKHKTSGGPRKTHGIDFFLPYMSPLQGEVLNNLIISVKFGDKEYPDNPTGHFRSHFDDLAEAISCFKHSQQRQNSLSGRRSLRKSEEIGVLFWLSNAPETYDDLIGRIPNIALMQGEGHETIYLVDNKRAAFIFDALMYARRVYEGADIEFYYFDTGQSTNPLTKQPTGSVLPVEYVNTSVLPLRVQPKTSEGVVLMLFCIELFSEGGLKLLLGMAQKLSGSWASKIILCFPDYNPLRHENTVQEVKAAFSDRRTTAALHVRSFASDFLTLQ